MAPGRDVMTTGEEDDGVYVSSGNSFAAPTIAGLVAYWRGLPGIKNGWDEELKKPANVKKCLLYIHRPLFPGNRVDGLDESKLGANKHEPKGRGLNNLFAVPFILSGEYKEKNCLTDPDMHPRCPKGSLADLAPFGAGCDQYTAGPCVEIVPGGLPTNTPGPGAFSDTITFQTGSANVTCAAESPGCGSLCTGFYCGSTATANSSTTLPPDRYGPKNPSHTFNTLTGTTTVRETQATSVTNTSTLSVETIISTMVSETVIVEVTSTIPSRPRAVEAFVTILEDGKTVCVFSIVWFPDTEGQNCLEKQINAGGTECRPIGRIASWTDGLSDMEFVSSTGGSEYTCHLFFAQVMEREV
ncbi:hypothetical protein QC764_0000650 [Podospora pseudoanserina]|uniref:Peptidase S8/S53 domain-containing protein n=1 Tax=Podospora pseudoanserina TaxID=2609844 RepID=A0ABR0IKR1_9PEZI|nr:hypothetical protein QC764_0000650 [Podospora pseudoanserina]